MKRCFFTMVAMVLAFLFVPTPLHAQKIYTNAAPMTFAHNMNNYWTVFKVDVTRFCEGTPEDKFFAPPPGYAGKGGNDEVSSIGTECAHAADEMDNMCTRPFTGKSPGATDNKNVYNDELYGRAAMKIHTKAAVMAALAEGVALCNLLFDNFTDADTSKMVMSQHTLQPYASTLFNVIAHTREVWGRIYSFMIAMQIPIPKFIGAGDPDNPKDLIYCGGKEFTDDSMCQIAQGKAKMPDSFKRFDPQFKPAAGEPK